MNQFLPFIVIGITTGAVYGLAGTGLVLTYKTSGIFNFAYGSIAALSVFVFYFLRDQHGLPWPLAAVVCVLIMGPVEGVLLELVARRLDPVSATLKVVATVGLLLVVLGVGTLWFGNQTSTFPSFLPTSTVRLAGVNVTWEQIIVLIVSVVASAALYYVFRFVRLGVAMRGVVDNPELLDMTGESAVRVRRWAWVIGTVFASAAGLLLAPSLSLNALIITMLVVQAFGAAAIGFFSNLPLTFAGGLAIGIAAALASKYVVSISWLSGLPVGLPFIILFVVLIVTPKGRLMERRIVHKLPVRSSWYAPTKVRLVVGAVVLVALAFAPEVVGARLTVWSGFLIDVILFLSLGLVVRKAGQISLCHLAFAAVGAAAFGHLLTDWHVPWLAALVVSGLVAVPVGALIAIPAIRLSGVFLAIATFGFGVLLDQMVYPTNLMFGVNAGVPTPRPDVSIGGWDLSSDSGFYYLLLVFALLAVVAVVAAERGRLGRLLGGLADSPLALEAHGTTTNTTLVLVFCVGAAMAAVAGALTSSLYSYAVGANFDPFTSLTLVALVVIVTVGDPWYAVVAALGFAVFPGYVTVGNVNTYLEIVFGLFAAVFALQNGKAPSVPEAVRRRVERLAAPRPSTVGVASTSPRPAIAANVGQETAGAGRAGLEVQRLSVRFGGLQAADGVSISAAMGTISGLIGPNGAGKTTIFNVCSGLVRPSAGRVVLHGADVTRMAPAERARRGLGRSFQRVQLFDSLTVRQNVHLGREASMAGANPLTQLLSKPRQRSEVLERGEEALCLVGIEELADQQAGLLSTGQRRLVELARVLAGPFDVLLLDEPSSGLDAAESRHFGDIVSEVVRRRGIAVLLIEHDMTLVRQVCSDVYVIDFGRLIFEGTTKQMLASQEVRNAYLGSAGTTTGLAPLPQMSQQPSVTRSPSAAVAASTEPVLDLQEITAGYGESVVLRQVSLSVPRSGAVALLGPNGAGKTTLLRTAAGLVRPMSGRVRLAGSDVTGRSAHELARAGLCHLPEGRGIFPSLTVAENLLLAAPKGRRIDAAEKAGEKFPVLRQRIKQVAGSLSGGEQQMLALARAFLTEPAVVVVDEPSLGLSPLVVDQIFASLQAIVRSGTAVLLVEQYVNRALELADTVYLLNRGTVAFTGAAKKLSDSDIFERYLGIEVGTRA